MAKRKDTIRVDRDRWLFVLRRVAISFLHEGNTTEALRYFAEIRAHEEFPDDPEHADMMFCYRRALGWTL